MRSVGSSDLSSEITIVGGGLAGTALAAVLGRQGRRVILVDRHSDFPPLFRAEKVEHDQVVLLRKFGLLEHLLPHAGRVSEVLGAYDGRIFKRSPIEQYGLRYQEMVNALRAEMPSSVVDFAGRVEAITNSDGLQRVKLAGGEELTSRLVVLASGGSVELQAGLGLRRRIVQKDQSFGFGFDIAPASQPFPFEALTYYCICPSARIDYLSLWRFRNTMRANLFVFRSPSDPWVREFIEKPEAMLRRHLPKLSWLIGDYCVGGKVDTGRTDLYTTDYEPKPGVVMIGDAFQSPCPAAGMGLDKVLTDVDVLSECIPRWFASTGMGADKLSEFYQHPRKIATDSRALRRARDHRHLVIDPSLRWRVHRFLLRTKWQLLASRPQTLNVCEALAKV